MTTLRMTLGKRAKMRAFVELYAAAKQLVYNHPKRFPYFEYWVKHVLEPFELAPPIERTKGLE